jgi:hypothetical protein
MSDGFAPEFSLAGYEQQLEPEEFRAMIRTHNLSQRVRWWRSSVDVSYNSRTGFQDAANNKPKWVHEEQDTQGFRAIIQDGRVMKKYQAQGEYTVGDMTCMTMPDELPFGDHDWVVPMGRVLDLTRNQDIRLLQFKEGLMRGSRAETLTGTLTATGTAIVGVGTTFTTSLSIGDMIRAAGQCVRVSAITDNTHITADVAPSPVWSGNTFEKLTESVSMWPAFALESVRDAATIYILGVDVTLAADGRSLQWLSATSPAFDVPVSLVYRYYPRYQVLGDQGMFNTPVHGVPLPQIVQMRLVKQDTVQE